MYSQETIAAVATALSPAGIGIIRISGPEAIQKADQIFRSPSGKVRLTNVPSHTIHYGYVYDGDEMIDEVLVSVFRAPRSYTAEDTAEINCHGGIYALQRVLQAVYDTGVRPADPGEFSKRAFLNGRMDLSQAEAVMDIISAKNDLALSNSVSQLRGSVKEAISSVTKKILHETARIEAALDDPEHYSLDGYAEDLRQMTGEWKGRISRMIETSDQGQLIKEGIKTAIVGRPNAGKSSLLNALLGQERAIVTQVPGTTRDILTEEIRLDGMTLLLCDTAGIRKTDDIVEKIGVDKAVENMLQADLILHVIDGSEKISAEDEELIRMGAGKKKIYILNKSDKEVVTDEETLRSLCAAYGAEGAPVLSVSAREGWGIDALLSCIRDMFISGEVSFNDEVIITSMRQKQKLRDALLSLEKVEESIDLGLSEDFFTIDLTAAYESLGNITGEVCSEDLVNEIFDSFCMGK